MNYDFSRFKEKLKDAEEWLAREYLGLNTGRATPAVLDGVGVESYGARMSISHVASIVTEDARTLRISPWDKTNVKTIEKAINEANLGLSVSVDDAGIRVFFPALTEERRQSLVKILKERLEEGRIKVRTLREETSKDIETKEKSGGMSEDEKFRHKETMQKMVDEANSGLENLFKKKEKDVMGT